MSTPIGNSDDITVRAKKALIDGIHFLAEDTRVVKHLMNRLDIPLSGKKIIAFHDHSGEAKFEHFLNIVKEDDLYLVSDAGSPIISDPAFPLVRFMQQQKIEIDSFGGVSSVISALELSGLPPHPFHFHGFLPREKEKKGKMLDNLSTMIGTHIFFEGPSRVRTTLEQMSVQYPKARICVARELTKKFQNITSFIGEEFFKVIDQLTLKGEFVLLIHIPKEFCTAGNSSQLRDMAQEVVQSKGKTKVLCKLLAQILDESSKDLYKKLS